MQFKAYELFISEIFHLICSHGWPWVTENETMDKRALMYPKQ
jgi:hypothetical protein